MGDIAITVQDLSKQFIIGSSQDGSLRDKLTHIFSLGNKSTETFNALSDVSFNIKRGEAVGIIGRNGAGKSTLLKVLSKITPPSKGQVEIEGRVSSLLEVGTGFHPELTGRENIYLNGTILGMTRKEVKEKFQEIVDFSGVNKFLDTPVKRYSSGMYVRLAFAVAAHLEPEILIIDEVLAVGDYEFQQKCLGKMKDVASQGKTVLFVSHNMGVIQSLCNRVIYLKDGKVECFGETEKIIAKYMNSGQEIKVVNRKEVKSVFFSNIWLSKVDEAENAKNEFSFNEGIQINGEIECITDFSRSIQLCFALLDKNGTRVTSIIDDVSGLKKGDKKQFALILPHSIIAPNNYSFLAEIYIPPGIQKFDVMENIMPLEIVDNGSRLSGYEDYGNVLLDYKWNWNI